MNLNDHPHPYGIVIAGNDLGTPTQSYLYCAAYGNGNFIVRGFGPEPFQVNGRRGEPNAAVAKAAGPDSPSSRTSPCPSRATRWSARSTAQSSAATTRRAGDGGQAEVDRRRLRHPLRAQHGSDRQRPDDDEELGVGPGPWTRRSFMKAGSQAEDPALHFQIRALDCRIPDPDHGFRLRSRPAFSSSSATRTPRTSRFPR